MSKKSRNSNNATGESAPKTLVEKRLSDADVRVDRSVNVVDGTKTCIEKGHADPANHTFPGLTDENYTIHGGNGLVIFDIDDRDKLPEWVINLPQTLIVKSPHGGYHLYYAVKDDTGIGSTDIDGGSVRYSGYYAVGPGSTIDHKDYCEDGKEGCPGEGIGEYIIYCNKPIPTLSGEHLENLRETCDSDSGDETQSEEYGGEKITLPKDALVDEGERYICTEFTSRQDTGDLASREIMDFLRGGTGSYELLRDDGTGINQSAADYYALEMLYGAFLFRGEDEETAKQLTLAVFKRYCRAKPYDKTGNLRKWLRKGEGYLTGEGVEWDGQMDVVQEEFDRGGWHRWRRRDYEDGFNAEEHTPWADPEKDGIPSLITQDTVRATLQILTSDLEPEYVARQYGLDASSIPTPSCGEMFTPRGSTSACDSRQYPVAEEVGEAGALLNPEREASYLAEVVKKLSRHTDEVAHAYCPSRPNGERHVYYPVDLPDPEDTRWVKVNGEKRDPELPEQKIMTDGGTSMSKTEDRDTLERIRQARDSDNSSTDGPEVYTCPIDGCSRTVVGKSGHLMNHVSQASDDAHRHRTLTEDLEVVVHWEEMDWSFGVPAFDSAPTVEERELVYDQDVSW